MMNDVLRAHSRYRAFTLIELLVVMTIIAILVSILLPALSRVRKQARLVVCTVNLKEIGHGLMMYSMDNNDYYPSKKAVGGWKFRAAPGYRDPHDSRGLPESFGLSALLDGRGVDVRTGQLLGGKYRYIDGQSDIWVCPDCQLDWMEDMGNTYSYRIDTLITDHMASVLQRPVVKVNIAATGEVGRTLITANEWLVRDNTGQLPYTPGFEVPEGAKLGSLSFVPKKKDYPHLFGGDYIQASNTLYLDLHVDRSVLNKDRVGETVTTLND